MQFSRTGFFGCTRFRGADDDVHETETRDHRHLLLFPAVRLAHVNPAQHVRHEFPLQATYFRRVLPHVRGFPTRGVLCSIRDPRAFGKPSLFGSAYLPQLAFLRPFRFRHNSVSGFPLACLTIRIPY